MKKRLVYILLCATSCLAIIAPEAKNRIVKTSFEWGTHQAPLATAVMNTTGGVLELGMGDFSTPLLHALCTTKTKSRPLHSVENNPKWYSYFIDLQNSTHTLFLVKDVLEYCTTAAMHWSVAFIDHQPSAQRKECLKVLRDLKKADVFVLHDAERKNYYEDIPSTFKYQYLYDRYRVQTLVLSDTIDVREWFK
jgi:hypothetical protein